MSNPRLESEIKRALGLDPTVRMEGITVQVVGGAAVLVGTVATLEEKEAAARAAAGVRGVRTVENRLTVSANHAVSDRKLNRKLDQALEGLPDDQRHAVGAVSEDGIAHLVGHASSAAVAESVRDAARRVEGVKSVVNEIQIDGGAPMDAASVSNRVVQALVQSGLLTSSTIEVDAIGGQVVLKGIVGSQDERDRAEETARRVAGVSHIANRLRIGDITERPPATG